MTDVIYRNGHFVWREIFTQDVEASTRFYAELFGWKAESMPMPTGESYTMLKAGDTGVGGIMKHPMADAPSFWGGYVSVDDVDAAAKRATGAGGKLLAGPMDAGGIGRFVTVQDPQGAVVSAWKSNMGDGEPPAQAGAGLFCWEQLNTSDRDGATAFYAALFGWTDAPFGSTGAMRVWSAGKTQVASVMPAPEGVPSHWLSYVVVDDLAAANARVERSGGKVLVPRMDIPDVGAIAVVQDNVGAFIGTFEAPTG